MPSAYFDMAAVQGLLKELYTDDKVENLVYEDRPFLALVRKFTEFGGEWLPVPMIVGALLSLVAVVGLLAVADRLGWWQAAVVSGTVMIAAGAVERTGAAFAGDAQEAAPLAGDRLSSGRAGGTGRAGTQKSMPPMPPSPPGPA